MGLVLLGTGNGEALQEMVTYAHQTKHEKIIRGLALGIAMIVYGREEEADTLIEQLLRDKDPILRYGGMYAIAMAYVGTANNSAVKKLLHVAVSDVSDDVRRAAVAAIGFVLVRAALPLFLFLFVWCRRLKLFGGVVVWWCSAMCRIRCRELWLFCLRVTTRTCVTARVWRWALRAPALV